jgi:hypothetical protein
MILLVSRVAVSQDDTARLSQETGMELRAAESVEQAFQIVRGTVCQVAVVDAGFVETDPKGVDALLFESVSAVPIFPNLAVCGLERLAAEIKAALRRGEKERLRAGDCARTEFRSDLKDTVTALLLNCDLAFQIPELSPEAAKKIYLLHELASKMRDQLESDVQQAASA